MKSQKQNEYLEYYQKNLFQESKNDLIQKANAKRKCISQTFKDAIKLINNTTTCDLLNDMLSSYNNLVDDQVGINNYADMLQVLTNPGQRECDQWESHLNSYSINELVQPLTCGEIKCKNSEITENQLKILFEKNRNGNPSVLITKPKNPNMCSNITVKPFGQNPCQNVSKNKPLVFPNSKIPNNTLKINNNSPNSSQEEDKNRFYLFKTAKDEYMQKFGKKGQQMSNSGAQKRSLGARRNVAGKFTPPIKREIEDGGVVSLPRYMMEGSSNENGEEVDERLRNIDAKMVELIRSEIMDCGPPITWDDIAGLEFAKTAIKEAVIWPLLRPDIFTGLRRPPKGILLFGPPGTGKTLIGKCIASQSESTFFSISASSLTSKWIGDGEKMVRAMFAVARCHQPAVIFIDEIDSLLSQRSDTEHESSRRIKTEFLVQLDGASTAEEDRILLVGATNRPQELDEAARRRFVKRLYIPLPEKAARFEIVRRLMCTERNNLTKEDTNEIAELTEGYSGADMRNVCSEASLGPIRSIDMSFIADIHPDEVAAVTMDDFRKALRRVRASVSPADLDQYVLWDRTYGSGG